MKAIARTFYKIPSLVIFVTAVPLFYFLFILVYNPFDISSFLAVGKDQFTLNLIVCTLIVLGVMGASRTLLYLLRDILDLNRSLYVLWCVGEIVLCGLFMSIPMGIGWVQEKTYFEVMSLCVLYTAGILAIPLSILSMAIQIHVLNKRSELAPAVDERTLIRFYDEQKRLKLVVSSESVLYIEAEENYVHVVYLDGGRVRDFPLRSSMRALEEVLSRHPLVRCHRSYFLNASHVDLLRKDSGGYALAQLDREGLKPIPVSKRYYESLSKML